MIDLYASAANPWPKTTPTLEVVCRQEEPTKDGKAFYGANEFIVNGKICRWALVQKVVSK